MDRIRAACAGLCGCVLAAALLGHRGPVARDERASLAPFVAEHCAKCHTGPDSEGEIDFDVLLDASRDPAGDLSAWRAIRKQLRRGAMPPKKEPRPPKEEVEAALGAVEAVLDARAAPSSPGKVTLRRLNRVEYENTVRDLVGVEFDAEATFPLDDTGYGFDTIGDVLSMPDVLFEKYLGAAERIAERAIRVADPDRPLAQRIPDERIVHTEKISTHGGSWSLYFNAFVGVDFEFEHAGAYRLRARAWASQAGPDPARMVMRFGEAEVGRFDVLATEAGPEVFEVEVTAEPGSKRFSAEFVNDFWNPDEPDRKKRDRNLYVEWLEVAGPIGFQDPTPFQRSLAEAGDLRAQVEELATRAWRRPVGAEEVERLLSLSSADDGDPARLQTALVALLASPHFLFRLELFRLERDPEGAVPGSVRDLDGFELASRLSYFLWSTMPDERLSESARSGALATREGLLAEVRRMLRDPRASELARNFAGQWLQLRTLERVQPDSVRFPGFDDELRASMRAETELLFEAVLREERPVSELIDPDFTFVDARLAKHYAIPGVDETRPRRIRLEGELRETRGGLLQQASMLAVTSNPTRTSPVKRGKWILETLLGSPPLAPQPGVDSLDESAQAVKEASLRERLARHRADPSCASCHDRMDALGFALENYDPVGRWRAEDAGRPVDASGELADGTVLDGPASLERRIARDPAFVRCVAEKLAIFALGRGLGPEDEPAFDELEARLGGADPTLRELIEELVQLDLFRRTLVASRAESEGARTR